MRLGIRQRFMTLLLIGCSGLLIFCKSDSKIAVENQWISIFNGENLEGWTPKFKGCDLLIRP